MNQFTEAVGIRYPLIGGPMYPCSNPELVAAISDAGAIGIVQPLSLTYVHGYDYAAGLDYILSLTDKPIGFNALIEKSSARYQKRMQAWIDISLQKGIRFFITSLGKPDWVVQRVHEYGGLVYHDVTEKKWAQIGIDCGADGLICVNNRAGGHAGRLSPQQLLEDLLPLGKPLVCAGGIADHAGMSQMLALGYQACQLGTRFIASDECKVKDEYKQAILDAKEEDIVLTEKMTGVPVSIIKPEQKQAHDFQAKGLLGKMLVSKRFKHITRMYLTLKSAIHLKKSVNSASPQPDYWQAGKSVGAISKIKPVAQIINDLMSFSD